MFADGVIESSPTTGTGTYTLAAAVGAARRFQQDFADGAEIAYFAQTPDRSIWEYGTGVLTVGPPCRLTRVVRKSSNGGAAIDWQVGANYLVFSLASADVLSGLIKGNLAETTRPWWVRAGGRWLDYAAGIDVSWIDKLATGPTDDIRVGRYDALKNAYFPDSRRPWTAVGAGNKTIAAADVGGIFAQDNSAASRLFVLPPHGDPGIGDGFKVGGISSTAGGLYGVVLTPAAGDGIDGGADAATKTIPGGVRFDVEWDQAGDTWRVTYLNTAQAWETGDYRISSRASTSLPGWVKVDDGTIGSAASGGTTRANADTADLFAHLWTTFSNSLCPVSGGRGANAAADYAANKTITLSAMLGRALVVAGAGSGLTSRALGDKVGAETHTHTGTTGGPSATANVGGGGTDVGGNNHTHSFTTAAGSSMQPSTFVNVFMKL